MDSEPGALYNITYFFGKPESAAMSLGMKKKKKMNISITAVRVTQFIAGLRSWFCSHGWQITQSSQELLVSFTSDFTRKEESLRSSQPDLLSYVPHSLLNWPLLLINPKLAAAPSRLGMCLLTENYFPVEMSWFGRNGFLLISWPLMFSSTLPFSHTITSSAPFQAH